MTSTGTITQWQSTNRADQWQEQTQNDAKKQVCQRQIGCLAAAQSGFSTCGASQ